MPTLGMEVVVQEGVMWCCCFPFLYLATIVFPTAFSCYILEAPIRSVLLQGNTKSQYMNLRIEFFLTIHEDFPSGEHLTNEIVHPPGKKLKTCRLNTARS